MFFALEASRLKKMKETREKALRKLRTSKSAGTAAAVTLYKYKRELKRTPSGRRLSAVSECF